MKYLKIDWAWIKHVWKAFMCNSLPHFNVYIVCEYSEEAKKNTRIKRKNKWICFMSTKRIFFFNCVRQKLNGRHYHAAHNNHCLMRHTEHQSFGSFRGYFFLFFWVHSNFVPFLFVWNLRKMSLWLVCFSFFFIQNYICTDSLVVLASACSFCGARFEFRHGK